MFIRGTRVHTANGLRPIDALGEGDLVLARPENGTDEPVFRPIKDIVRTESCVIREVSTLGPDAATGYCYGVSRDQRFRTPKKGWVPADKLRNGHRLMQADGSCGEVSRQFPIYRTATPGVGWVQALKRLEGSWGSLFDYENYAVVNRDDGGEIYLSPEVASSRDRFLKVTAFGLRVHEHNNFHVGSQGCWVHGESEASVNRQSCSDD